MSTLFYFRTHFIDKSVISEFKKLSESIDIKNGDECILFIDNHTNFLNIDCSQEPVQILNIENETYKCFIYDKQIHDEIGLPYFTEKIDNGDLSRIMWYCSDYPFYIMRRYFPTFDYYWSIESDVFCNGKNYSVFLNKYSNKDKDLLVQDYRNVDNESWYWKLYSDWVYGAVPKYACFFPVVRLSARAVDFLFNKRLEHVSLFSESTDSSKRWLFCEFFVPTELTNNGYQCGNITGEKLRYNPVYNLNKERIFEAPDNKLYHPVK